MFTYDRVLNKCKKGRVEMKLANEAGFSNNDFIEMYRKMWQIRIFEETLEQLYKNGEIHGTMHLCTGQEATAAGSAGLLRKQDWITSTHRNHGHSIAKGTSIEAMLAEILGKKTGTNQGKGGSMHIADPDHGHLGSNGIVGAGFPIAAGAALTAQMNGTDQVVICYSGDGATNEGSFHEAMNLASLWHLPVIYFVENNQYGMSTATADSMNIRHISQRSQSYGIEGITIDGNDLIEVINTTFRAIQKAQSGGGPTLIEAMTYRYCGHSKSDQRLYRKKTEEQWWQDNFDPIKRTKKTLLEHGILTKEECAQIPLVVQTEIKAAVVKVRKDPKPDLTDLETQVYAE